MEYRGGVTADWAAAVARGVHRRSREQPPPSIDEAWLDAELMLHVRYRLGRKKVAARFRLDTDPESGVAPVDSDGLAAGVFRSLRTDHPATFVDRHGYRWWGTEPPGANWAGAIGRARIMTIS